MEQRVREGERQRWEHHTLGQYRASRSGGAGGWETRGEACEQGRRERRLHPCQPRSLSQHRAECTTRIQQGGPRAGGHLFARAAARCFACLSRNASDPHTLLRHPPPALLALLLLFSGTPRILRKIAAPV
eukprot:3729688-Rhodomonas_salina.1